MKKTAKPARTMQQILKLGMRVKQDVVRGHRIREIKAGKKLPLPNTQQLSMFKTINHHDLFFTFKS